MRKAIKEADVVEALISESTISAAAKKIGVTRATIYNMAKKHPSIRKFTQSTVTEKAPLEASTQEGEKAPIDLNYILKEKQDLYESIPKVKDIISTLMHGARTAVGEAADSDKAVLNVKKMVNTELASYVKVRAEARANLNALENFYKVFGDVINQEANRIQKMPRHELVAEARALLKEIDEMENKRKRIFDE